MTETAETEKSDSKSEDSTETTSKSPLEDLLASYGKDDKGQAKTDDLVSEVKALREDLASRDYRDVMDRDVIPSVKGEFSVPDDYVEHWVNKQADANPKLLELWNDRKGNPAAFNEAIEALTPKFAEHVEKQFGLKTDDSGDAAKRLASVVKGSRETDASPSTDFDDVNWGGLSDQDLTLKKAELFRAVEAGELR